MSAEVTHIVAEVDDIHSRVSIVMRFTDENLTSYTH